VQDAGRWSKALRIGDRIVEEEARRYLASDASRVAGPTIAAIRRQAARVCERELDQAVGASPTLDRAAARAALHRVVAKQLQVRSSWRARQPRPETTAGSPTSLACSTSTPAGAGTRPADNPHPLARRAASARQAQPPRSGHAPRTRIISRQARRAKL